MQQKYNKILSIIVNVEKNVLIVLPFSVRLFQVVLFLLFQQLLNLKGLYIVVILKTRPSTYKTKTNGKRKKKINPD